MMFIRSTLLFASVILLLVISVPASHAEQHQDRLLKKKNKKNSKASKAQKGAGASSGKGGKGATTSQPSAAPSETPSAAPSETPTSSDPCYAAFAASTSCNGVFSCACLVGEGSTGFSECCQDNGEGSALCVAAVEYVLDNCFIRA